MRPPKNSLLVNQYLIQGVFAPEARKQTRNKILYPTTTTKLFEETNSSYNDLAYIMIGAGVTAMSFAVIILIFAVLYHLNR